MMTNTTDNNTVVRETIPNKAFDTEYMTEWVREVKFLADKGIRYTFVKKTPKYNIKQYKYKKTPELFIALAEFYYQTTNEKAYNRLNKAIEMFSVAPNPEHDVPKELAEGITKSVNIIA